MATLNGTFTRIGSTVNQRYSYVAASIIVEGSYKTNGETGDIIDINSDCYRNENGQKGLCFGNFNGYPSGNGDILYALSQMRRADSNLVWDAIDEIEPNILNTNQQE